MELANLIRTKSDPTLRRGEPLNILFASTEVAPFSKTGGLGDVAAALPGALAARGTRLGPITALGTQYSTFARTEPGVFRLMFGLTTGHDANAVLMSLPPLAKWV